MGRKESITAEPLANEDGTAVIEAALVIPFVVLLLMGIIQYGYILASYITLRNATAVAARHAILDDASNAQVVTVAANAVAPMLDSSNVDSVHYDNSYPYNGTTYHRVAIVYRLKLFLPYAVPGAGSNGEYTMTAATLML